MSKLAIAALAAASVAFVATADTPAAAAPRDATAIGTIVLEENFEDYAKVTTNANGQVVVEAVRNDGTVVSATVYTKDKVDADIAAAIQALDAANFKTKQTAVADPTASGNATAFIDTISQNANGEVTVTKKNLPNASTSTAGIVQLSSATTSTATDKAATPAAVKTVKDIADAKQDPATTLAGYGIADATVTVGSGADAGKDTVKLGANTTTVYNTTKVDALLAGKKDVQTAKTDPTASGTGIDYIATIAQDVNGEITATKSTVRSASTTQTGVVQLSSATDSTSETLAATPAAVKAVKDVADAKQDPATTLAGYGIADAKIDAGTITLGNGTITPLTASSDLTTAMGTSVDTKVTAATNALATAVAAEVAAGYKPKQTAVADPTQSGNGIDYIATIEQDANGVITATKSTVRSASTSQTGVVKLNNTVTSASTSEAATANAVKTAKDAADAKVPLANLKVDGTALTSATVVELGNAYIVCATVGEGATAKKRAVLYTR